MVHWWTHLETISPPMEDLVRPGVKHYVPWVPDWLDLNVMVPLIATVIVVAVGILVVCVALTRRHGDDGRNGPKDVYCRFSGAGIPWPHNHQQRVEWAHELVSLSWIFYCYSYCDLLVHTIWCDLLHEFEAFKRGYFKGH